MLRSAVPCLLACFLAIAGCGSGTDTGVAAGAGGGTSSSGTGGGDAPHIVPPPAGPAKAPDGTGSVSFAIRRVFVGDTDRDGALDVENGWKGFGYDIDGLNSSEISPGLCKLLPGAPKSVAADGHGGIDNAFGHMLLPIFRGIASDFSTQLNDAIAGGAPTTLITLDALGAGTDYNPVTARIY